MRKDLFSGKEILINKKTGKKISNIEKKEDPITGEIKLINKENSQITFSLILKKSLFNLYIFLFIFFIKYN